MSGIIGGAFTGPTVPTQIGTLPPEGSRSATTIIPWQGLWLAGSQSVFQVNLLAQFQSGRFTTVQAVWINNLGVPWAVTVTCQESGQILVVPPFSQGMYPLIGQQSPIFTITLQTSNSGFLGRNPGIVPATTTLIWLNTPQRPYQTQQPPWGGFLNTVVVAIITAGPTTLIPALPNALAGQFFVLMSLHLILQNKVAFASAQSTVDINNNGTDLRDGVGQGVFSTFLPYYIKEFVWPAGFILQGGAGFPVQINTNGNDNTPLITGNATCTYGIITCQ